MAMCFQGPDCGQEIAKAFFRPRSEVASRYLFLTVGEILEQPGSPEQ